MSNLCGKQDQFFHCVITQMQAFLKTICPEKLIPKHGLLFLYSPNPDGNFCPLACLQYFPQGLMAKLALMPTCKFFILARMQCFHSGQPASDSFRREGKFFPQAAGRNLLHVYSMHFLHLYRVQILHEIPIDYLINDSYLL